MSITSNAILVRLATKTFRRTVTDTDVSQEVTRGKGATDEAGKFVKMLFSPEALRPFTEIQSAAQKLLREYCKPWDLGVHILAMTRFSTFQHKSADLVAQFDAARDGLVDTLPQHIAEARRNMGDLFDATLYPDAEILRRQCQMAVRFSPVPDDKSDIRVTDTVAAEAMKEAIINAHGEFAESMATSLHASLTGMTQRLEEVHEAAEAGTRSRFSKSLIEGLRKAVKDAETYNFSGDPKIVLAINHMRDNLLFKLDCIPLELAPEDPARVRAIADALSTARNTQMDLGGLL